jgi:hypothetical protein
MEPGDLVQVRQADGSWQNGWRLALVQTVSTGTRARIESADGSDYRVVAVADLRPCPPPMNITGACQPIITEYNP